ncbi:uncharacterized protein DUF1127 [Aminobacter aminovorans]|jgi:hypothetical protein|uniref:Uncharacterized conserved small protein n=1 Tax=Aminobacter aminovorans TaxID=83263 RepID=A0A380WD20_AMIAI|nr:DUF1127 domain-containing protein [Aminobacter aminovorans]TCS25237.1 uncharacterized protein DUF1127 [Aminobacter aminovorans]SUU86887.1 Uncharacterized conserved small protein [Aminobacter aminovorans]
MTTKSEFATAPRRLPLGVFGRVLACLSRGYDRHLQRLDLSELTDEQLDDIGVCRREAEREIAKPFWR